MPKGDIFFARQSPLFQHPRTTPVSVMFCFSLFTKKYTWAHIRSSLSSVPFWTPKCNQIGFLNICEFAFRNTSLIWLTSFYVARPLLLKRLVWDGIVFLKPTEEWLTIKSWAPPCEMIIPSVCQIAYWVNQIHSRRSKISYLAHVPTTFQRTVVGAIPSTCVNRPNKRTAQCHDQETAGHICKQHAIVSAHNGSAPYSMLAVPSCL